MDFISESNRMRHKEALGQDILRLGIIERSVPEVAVAEPVKIARMRVPGLDMRAAAELKASIILHKVFFGSFLSEGFSQSAAVRLSFGSERSLCERMLGEGLALRLGFAALVKYDGKLAISASESALGVLKLGDPLLAVDLFEHAYYGDFGFDKEAYLRAALSRLKLGVADA